MADRALGNPLGNPLGLARSGGESPRRTVATVQTNSTFVIPAKYKFAVLHWFGSGGAASTYVGGGGGGYAGTKPINLQGLASRSVTVSGNFSCTGLGYTLSTSSEAAPTGRIGIGGDYNYRGGTGGWGGQDITTKFYGAGGGAAGPSGNGADGGGWYTDPVTFVTSPVPPGSGASGGGGTTNSYTSNNKGSGGGGGGGIGNGGLGGDDSTVNPPSEGIGESPYFSPLLNGGNANTGNGGNGGLGGGGAGAGVSPGTPGQFLLVIELW